MLILKLPTTNTELERVQNEILKGMLVYERKKNRRLGYDRKKQKVRL
jgi:hypothetical protein